MLASQDNDVAVSAATIWELRLKALPRHHDDPFDRILIAQAIAEGRRLVTKDEAILGYAGIAGFDPLSGEPSHRRRLAPARREWHTRCNSNG